MFLGDRGSGDMKPLVFLFKNPSTFAPLFIKATIWELNFSLLTIDNNTDTTNYTYTQKVSEGDII